jgi:hypothetical protein
MSQIGLVAMSSKFSRGTSYGECALSLPKVLIIYSVFSYLKVVELMGLGTTKFRSLFKAQSHSRLNKETPNGRK